VSLWDRFEQIWIVDTEYTATPGEHVIPICLVAHEVKTNKRVHLWQDELKVCPYPLDGRSLVVAYANTAELGFHLSCGWGLPERTIDLYAEFRCLTNICKPPRYLRVADNNGTPSANLLGAAAYFGLPHIDSTEKEFYRELCIRGGPFTNEEREGILRYCAEDVELTVKLWHKMSTRITNEGQALLRGDYTKAVARMEWVGIPLDMELWKRLEDRWDDVRRHFISLENHKFNCVYEGTTFKQNRFQEYLTSLGIIWPITETGRPVLRDETWGQEIRRHPELEPLWRLYQMVNELRPREFSIGKDGRNRVQLRPFSATTGRNQPKKDFLFGAPSWMRNLVQPPLGKALLYADWSGQEFAIAAALSKDPRMSEVYQSDDPYLAYAKLVNAAPPEATKETHKAIRDVFKIVNLQTLYGATVHGLSKSMKCDKTTAQMRLNQHKALFPKFWEWIDMEVSKAVHRGYICSRRGWRMEIRDHSNPRAILNFPMQATGVDLLQQVCRRLTDGEGGIDVCAPVHDCILAEVDIQDVDDGVRFLEFEMRKAGQDILGYEVKAKAETICHPQHLNPGKGDETWNEILKVLNS